MTDAEKKTEYAWCRSEDGNFQGDFDSVADAIAEALFDDEEGSVVYVGEIRRLDAAYYFRQQADSIIERAWEIADELVPEYSDDWPHVVEGGREALETMLCGWAKQYVSPPTFFPVVNVKRYGRDGMELARGSGQ